MISASRFEADRAEQDRVLAIIPARYASARFPGKPLVPIAGKPMIQHVVERAARTPSVDKVIVATDDRRIAEAVAAFGGHAAMTGAHRSGTDRIAEAAEPAETRTSSCCRSKRSR